MKRALGSIRSKYGVYACLGNHDSGSGFNEMTALLTEAGVRVLCEERTVIPGVCVLCGRAEASPIGGAGTIRRGAFSAMAGEEVDGLPVIVIDHNPAHYDEYGGDVTLLLCGHTHKGQMFPGSLITGGMYAADYGLCPAAGDRLAMVVTSGIGYWGPPLRVGTDSEIAVIELN